MVVFFSAYVKGNGRTTLGELIKKRNRKQRRMRLHKTFSVGWDFINRTYALGEDDVVPSGWRVQITEVGNFHNGCNPFHVPLKEIHPLNLKKWIAINDAIGAALTGMDYMSPNISEAYGFVIDVNSRPQNDINLAALPRRVGNETWLPFKPGWGGKGEQFVGGERRVKPTTWEALVPCYYRDRCRCNPRKNKDGTFCKQVCKKKDIQNALEPKCCDP